MAGRIDYLFPAACAGDRADQGRQGHGAGGQLRQARAALPGRADDGRDRLSEGGLRVLERRVRSGEDAARTSSTKLYDETQKAIADPGVKERLAKLGVEPLVDVAAGVREIFQGRRAGHRQARQGGRHREAVGSRAYRGLHGTAIRGVAGCLRPLGCRVRRRCGSADARELADQADPGDHADRARHRRRRRVPAGVPRAVEPARPADRHREPRRRRRHHRLGRGRQGRSGRLHDPRAVHLAHHRAGDLSEHELRRDARFHRRRAVRQDADRADHLAVARASRRSQELVAEAKAKPGTLHLRLGRRRIDHASDRGAIPAERGHSPPSMCRSAAAASARRWHRAGSISPSRRSRWRYPTCATAGCWRSRSAPATAHRAFPDVPTTLEAGYPNSDYALWLGMFVPANTPRAIVERLHDESIKALQSPALRERLAGLDVEPMVDDHRRIRRVHQGRSRGAGRAGQGGRAASPN